MNGMQSEIKRPITWRIYYLMREGRIPGTLSPLWEILGLMLSRAGIIKFGSPSWIHQNYFETPWGKLWNLFGMKLTTDITLLFFSAVDNGMFVYFLCHKFGLWNSLNQWIFVMLVLGFLVQLKWISKKPLWETILSCKCLFGECTPVRQ